MQKRFQQFHFPLQTYGKNLMGILISFQNTAHGPKSFGIDPNQLAENFIDNSLNQTHDNKNSLQRRILCAWHPLQKGLPLGHGTPKFYFDDLWTGKVVQFLLINIGIEPQ